MSCLFCLFIILIVGAGAFDVCDGSYACASADDEVSLMRIIRIPEERRGHSSVPEKDRVPRRSFESFLSTAQKKAFLMAAQKTDGDWPWSAREPGTLTSSTWSMQAWPWSGRGTAENDAGWWPRSHSKSAPVELSTFADMVEQTKKFVQSERLHFKVGPMEVHPFEVALYLDTRSPLWGKQNPTTEDLIGHTAGTTIVLKTTQEIPRLVPVTAVTMFLKHLFLPYVQASPGCSEADLDKLLEMINSEGHPPLGTVANIKIDDRGLEVDVEGRSKGRLDNTAITKAVVSMLVSTDSPVTGLRDRALARVAQGLTTGI